MNNKKKNILVWMFVWAGLLMAVLYSPIGSPDLYKSTNYFAVNQNVDFSEGNIENAPKGDGSGYQNDNNQIDIPDYNSSVESTSKYAVNTYSATPGSAESTASSSNYPSQSSAYQSSSNANSGGSTVGGGSTFISSNRSKGSSDASSSVTMNSSGITTLSTELTSSSTAQAASPTKDPNSTAHHPGHDPTGPPIPVGDGWIFLLLLAAGYGVWIKKFRVVTKTHIEE